jgi:hypothetical protein
MSSYVSQEALNPGTTEDINFKNTETSQMISQLNSSDHQKILSPVRNSEQKVDSKNTSPKNRKSPTRQPSSPKKVPAELAINKEQNSPDKRSRSNSRNRKRNSITENISPTNKLAKSPGMKTSTLVNTDAD